MTGRPIVGAIASKAANRAIDGFGVKKGRVVQGDGIFQDIKNIAIKTINGLGVNERQKNMEIFLQGFRRFKYTPGFWVGVFPKLVSYNSRIFLFFRNSVS
jgi:hypothetical protein